MKLRPKILLLVIGILIISFSALSIPLYWYMRSALEAELDKRLVSIAEVMKKGLSMDLLLALTREPALPGVRSALEQELASFQVEGIEGIAVFSQRGDELARWRLERSAQPQIPFLLQTLTDEQNGSRSAVSEIYQLADGTYLKAAAVSVDFDDTAPAILVVWGGAEFMAVIDQIVGSIFWIILVSVLVAVSLAVVFSRSLVHPVTQLSRYARSIQKNIHADTMDLQRTDEIGDLNRSLAEMHLEIRQNEQSMKQLLSGIAHEIKNPLGGIEIYTGLLQQALSQKPNEQDMAEHRSYLAKVSKELGQLKQIVLEYLDYAKPLKSQLTPCKIESVIEDIHRLLQPEIQQKHVSYTLSGHGVVLGDESKLRRVFLNLLKNSLEAVEGEGSVSITINSLDGETVVRVADDGRGIPETDLAKIFEPYYTTQDKGYGLGLAIVKNIIDEMNGTIIVSSEVGKGSTFTLKFPQAVA